MSERPVALLDDSAHRVYRLHDFTKTHGMEPGSYYFVSGTTGAPGSGRGADTTGATGTTASPPSGRHA